MTPYLAFKKKKNHGFVLITRHVVNIHLANRYVVSSILQVTLRMGRSKNVMDEFPHVSFRLLYVIVKKLKVADSRGGERTPPPGPPPSAPPPSWGSRGPHSRPPLRTLRRRYMNPNSQLGETKKKKQQQKTAANKHRVQPQL